MSCPSCHVQGVSQANMLSMSLWLRTASVTNFSQWMVLYSLASPTHNTFVHQATTMPARASRPSLAPYACSVKTKRVAAHVYTLLTQHIHSGWKQGNTNRVVGFCRFFRPKLGKTQRRAGRLAKRWEDDLNDFVKDEETEATQSKDLKGHKTWLVTAMNIYEWEKKKGDTPNKLSTTEGPDPNTSNNTTSPVTPRRSPRALRRQ